jgi:fatty-acyl-CoA synthase
VDLSGWKVVVGGSALPRGLALEAMRRGIDVSAGYGMSETCPVVTVSQVKAAQLGGQPVTDQATVDVRTRAGLPAPLVQLRVVDDAMRDVSAGEPGEVVLRAPFLTTGYVKDAAATARLWDGGWMHTGDIGLIDKGGYLHIVDRLKDVIKSGGEWVSSIEVEDVLSRHPDVAEAAVIGVPDPRWGERPLALVVPRPGAAAPDEAALRAHVAAAAETGALSRYAVPDSVLVVDAIEKTSVGKLDKKALRRRYDPSLAPPADAPGDAPGDATGP